MRRFDTSQLGCLRFEDENTYDVAIIGNEDDNHVAAHPFRRDPARGVLGASWAVGQRNGRPAQRFRLRGSTASCASAVLFHRIRRRGEALVLLRDDPEFWMDQQTANEPETVSSNSDEKIAAESSLRAA